MPMVGAFFVVTMGTMQISENPFGFENQFRCGVLCSDGDGWVAT